MDGDARRPAAPPDYKVHVDYDLPAARRPAEPEDKKTESAEPDKAQDGGQDDAKPKQPTPRWKKLLYWAVGAAVLLALIVGGLLYWLDARQYASTDDAFVDGYISQVSGQVSGRVNLLAVRDYEHVKQGQLLVQLDKRDYQVRRDQAEAQRAQAAAQVEQARAALVQHQAAVDQAEANVRVTESDLAQARADLARYRGVDPRAISRQQLDTAGTSTRAAQARVDANQQAVAAARANVQAQQAQIDAAIANLKVADVAVANALLQLTYTDIIAPRDGQVAKRTVNLGDYVNAGQSLLAVVGDERWITANFKETQLRGLQVGQAVTVGVDACPDHGIEGTVDSVQPGSGSVFSSLPAENATGNYVKVVQRVPVKITLKDVDAVRCRLAPGMSVVPSVKVK